MALITIEQFCQKKGIDVSDYWARLCHTKGFKKPEIKGKVPSKTKHKNLYDESEMAVFYEQTMTKKRRDAESSKKLMRNFLAGKPLLQEKPV